jgi:hypothetical protein
VGRSYAWPAPRVPMCKRGGGGLRPAGTSVGMVGANIADPEGAPGEKRRSVLPVPRRGAAGRPGDTRTAYGFEHQRKRPKTQAPVQQNGVFVSAVLLGQHAWTLLAWCELRNDFRRFRLERIDRKGTEGNGTYLSPVSAATRMCSLDGAQRNPGIDVVANRFPRISLALHAGYLLRRMRPKCCILGQGRLS